MKYLVIFVIIIGYSQINDITGKYSDHFGSEYIINSDSTFEFNYGFDTYNCWTKGKWKRKNDTVFFNVTPIYDTLRIVGKKDTLLLSRTKTPNLILTTSEKEIIWPESTGEQSVYNRKLFFSNGNLYEIDQEGNLIKERKTQNFSFSTEKFDPWFTKKEK